jgi:transposase
VAEVKRYILPIDLGVKGPSYAVLCDEKGDPKSKKVLFKNRYGELSKLKALVPTPAPGEQVEVCCVYESTASAWKVVASFMSRDHWPEGLTVVQYRLKPQDVAAYRKAIKRHAKSDRIDTLVMGKLAAQFRDWLAPLPPPPSKAQLRIDRLARRHFRMTAVERTQKQRVWAQGVTLLPGIWDELGDSALVPRVRVLLRDAANPDLWAALGAERMGKRLVRKQAVFSVEELQGLAKCAKEAVELYAGQGAYVDTAQEQEELIETLDLLEYAEAASAPLERELKKLLDEQLDADGALRSIYGVGEIVASYILAAVGDIDRFASVDKFVGYTGFFPVTVQSVDDPRGVRMSKAGPQLLKVALYLAAETARRWDPEMAHVYHVQFVERGKDHNAALGHVVKRIATRVYAVLKRQSAKRRAIAAAGDDTKARAQAEALPVAYELRDPRQSAPRPVLPRAEAMALAADLVEATRAVREQRRRNKGKGGAHTKKAPAAGFSPSNDGQRQSAPKEGRRRRAPSARSVAERLGAGQTHSHDTAADPIDGIVQELRRKLDAGGIHGYDKSTRA